MDNYAADLERYERDLNDSEREDQAITTFAGTMWADSIKRCEMLTDIAAVESAHLIAFLQAGKFNEFAMRLNNVGYDIAETALNRKRNDDAMDHAADIFDAQRDAA